MNESITESPFWFLIPRMDAMSRLPPSPVEPEPASVGAPFPLDEELAGGPPELLLEELPVPLLLVLPPDPELDELAPDVPPLEAPPTDVPLELAPADVPLEPFPLAVPLELALPGSGAPDPLLLLPLEPAPV